MYSSEIKHQILRCTIHMEPAGKEEARRTRFGQVYKAAATRQRMNSIRSLIRKAYSGPLLDEPIDLEIRAYRTRPKQLKKSVQLAAVKPDWDNVGKLISDCLEGIVVVNDSRIARATVIKFFAPKGPPPWMEIIVSCISADTVFKREGGKVDRELFDALGLKSVMTVSELAVSLGMEEAGLMKKIRQYKIPFETNGELNKGAK